MDTWNKWSDEQTETAVKLWNEGNSAGFIAQKIGGLSRNAVIGKMHRLGLSRHTAGVSASIKRASRISAKRRRKRKPAQSLRFGKVKSLEALPAAPLPPEPPAPEKLFSLFDLTEREEAERVKLCRFIYGDPKQPGSGYCGCEKAPGSSYCPAHHQVVFQAPAPRTKHADPTFKHWVKRASNLGYTRKEVVF